MFKVSARTLLHLGAELISSDAVAFYELIKNAFDANSKGAKIEVISRLDFDELESLRELIDEERKRLAKRAKKLNQDELDKLLDSLRANLTLDHDDPAMEAVIESIENARTLDELEEELDAANYIVISDEGEGMSLQDLRDVYLTIGTSVRQKQREERSDEDDQRPILGEKGIGRLSVMRLGWKVRVETTQVDAAHWNVLDVNWRDFDDLDKTIEQVDVTPTRGRKKKEPEKQGTKIHISALSAPWSAGKLEEIAKSELSRFMDPFAKKQPFTVALRFNDVPVLVPRMQDLLFAHAHMKLEGTYRVAHGGAPRLEGALSMNEPRKEGNVRGTAKILRTSEQLRSAAKVTDKVLKDLGPFTFVLYWFNRRVLTKIDGIGDLQAVRKLVDQWSGIMLFRDGFRIHPYGNRDDDWLNFDKIALGRSAYKLNKSQFIGKIDITREGNPLLIDQSNREGLKDTREKQALIDIMFNLVQVEVYRIIQQWQKNNKKAQPAKVIRTKIESISRAQEQLVSEIEKLASTPGSRSVAQQLRNLLTEQVQPALKQAETFVNEAEDEREVLFHLAGIGLLLEVVVHELKRTTTVALSTVTKLAKLKTATDEKKLSQLVATLGSQLKTLEKQIRTLDPQSTSARHRKEKFDVFEWTQLVLDTHADEMSQAGIAYECVLVGAPSSRTTWMVEMVKGIFIQILENLINNSVYWLENLKLHDKKFRPNLRIEVNPKQKTLTVIDNGPGIPHEHGDAVFQPFFTTRPAGESRGLGLYIARENAKYNKLEIDVSEEPVIREGRYNAMVISWKEK